MNGIDISSWQTGIDLTAVPADLFESCVISAEFKALLYIHSKRSDEND